MNIKIAVEGFDGTGKTTIINKLIERYSEIYTTSVDRLIPSSVKLFKCYANNTRDYVNLMTDEFRIVSYLWESFLRLEFKEEEYKNNNLVFFDRWIFTNLTVPLNFGGNEEIVKYLISSIPKPEILFLIKMKDEKIIKNLTKKNDWMLSYYEQEDLLNRIRLFYDTYEKNLISYDIPYIVIDGNKPIKNVENEIFLEINKIIECSQEVKYE